jgi:uncharacterized protein
MWIIIGAAIIGLTLGLLGSGGSAITVPVLVYLVGHSTKQSMAESMAIVGIICAVAAIPYGRARLIDWHSVWYFGIPGMVGTFFGAWLGGLATDALQLAVFGVVLVVASISMLRKSPPERSSDNPPPNAAAPQSAVESPALHRSPIWKIRLEGTIVGIVTGFVGVGGGFLIVPALVIFGRLPMRRAIATSLVIIVLKSAIGFIKYEQYLLSHNTTVDVATITLFASIGIAGSLVGRLLNARMNQRLLKIVFAIFLIVLGGWLIVSEGKKLWLERTTTNSRQEPIQHRPAISVPGQSLACDVVSWWSEGVC